MRTGFEVPPHPNPSRIPLKKIPRKFGNPPSPTFGSGSAPREKREAARGGSGWDFLGDHFPWKSKEVKALGGAAQGGLESPSPGGIRGIPGIPLRAGIGLFRPLGIPGFGRSGENSHPGNSGKCRRDLGIRSGTVWEFRHPEWENSGIRTSGVGKFGNPDIRSGEIRDLGIQSGKIQDLGIQSGKIWDLGIQSGKIRESGHPEWGNSGFGHPEWENSGIRTSRVGKFGNPDIQSGKIRDLGIQRGKIQDLGIQSGKIQEFGHPEWENSGIRASRVGKFGNSDIQSGKIREFRHPEWENSGIQAPRVVKFGIPASRVEQFGNLGFRSSGVGTVWEFWLPE
ncbi:hypothetical protein DUI87_33346 [Hirundo rustica rustica]|uniref:Uncharacterized protein n=1 Tax=Hirundo rustica rustica TaxID=333673 RepID=A0A3M0IQU1_HIRRU|nr:hypothetical protein DUI87_33346 [Hirundo rustica rustica]